MSQRKPSQQLHNLSDSDYITEKFSLLIQHIKENEFLPSKIFVYLPLTSTEIQILHSQHLKTTGCFSQLIFWQVEPCINYGLQINIRLKIRNVH